MSTEWHDPLFRTVIKACIVNLIGYFRPDQVQATDQQRRFMAGEVRNPSYVYVGMDDIDFDAKLAALDTYKPTGSALDPLHEQVIARRRLMIALALASRSGNMEGFREVNAALGLLPDPRLYASILSSLVERATASSCEAGEKLLRLLPVSRCGVSLLPSSQLLMSHRDTIMAMCDTLKLATQIPSDAVWDARCIADYLERSLQSAGVTDTEVIVTNKQTRMSTTATKFIIPESRSIPAWKAPAIMAHERLHHERWRRGQLSRYFLLFTGTASNVWLEEGVTTVTEQGILGSAAQHPREDYYLAISLAQGLLGDVPRDFRDVCEIMVRYYRFADSELSVYDRSTETPEERAWIQANRTFRGTDCKTPGTFYGKDVGYTASNWRMWTGIAADPAIIPLFPAGKFNPAVESEVGLLTNEGAVPVLS